MHFSRKVTFGDTIVSHIQRKQTMANLNIECERDEGREGGRREEGRDGEGGSEKFIRGSLSLTVSSLSFDLFLKPIKHGGRT
jgi:hypothetical protein